MEKGMISRFIEDNPVFHLTTQVWSESLRVELGAHSRLDDC